MAHFLTDAIEAANVADRNFQAAVEAAGFKSRWDVPAMIKCINPQYFAAYDNKVEADRRMGEAFERQREADRLHSVGRTKAGNNISGL
jgi:hypothetical protein